jgi:hypothetical protein
LQVPKSDPHNFVTLASEAGCDPGLFSMFVKPDSDFTAAKLMAVDSVGAHPFVTLEPWSYKSKPGEVEQPKYSLKSVADGWHDAAFERLAEEMARYGKPVFLRFAHEMNGFWYPWGSGVNGNTPDEYLRAWRHVHDLFSRTPGIKLRWVWSPNIVQGVQPDAPALENFYPGDDLVDYVGLTGYGKGESAGETFDRSMDQLTKLTHRPVIISETGADRVGKLAWIKSFGPWLREHPRVRGFLWFNTTPASTGATGDYRFNVSPQHIAAFREMLKTANVEC